MSKINIRAIIGVLFLIVSIALITIIQINPTAINPSRSTVTRNANTLPYLGKGYAVTQELISNNNYLNGIDLFFTLSRRINTNANILLVLDSGYNILHREAFSSQSLKEGDYSKFRFREPVFVGKGNRIYLTIYSPDGTENNSATPLINTADSIGDFYVSKINLNDIIGSIKDKTNHLHAALMLQTYKTRNSQFWFMKIMLYALVLILSLIIIFYARIQSTLAKTTILPEWVYLAIALPFSATFAFVTPPMQVPDEEGHLARSFEVSEFHFSAQTATIPVSFLKLDSTFGRLRLQSQEKTTVREIIDQTKLPLEPQIRTTAANAPEYTVPYLPQALGIFIGKLFFQSPLILMYFGRIFNLIASILLIFLAIRIIPSFKWILLLLALMPKTLFLFGSLSYDTLTISLSFFTMALFLYYAFSCERNLRIKDLALIAVVVLLLLLCKPPYFVLALLFFLIPPKKFGYLYKYIMISIGVIVLALIIFKVGPAAAGYFSKSGAPVQQLTASPPATTEPLPLLRPDDQLKYITAHIPTYIKIMLESAFVVKRDYVIEGFFGLLGWIDIELPTSLTYAYLIFIVLASLVLANREVKLGLIKKSLLFLILSIVFVLIETAMYIYSTSVGKGLIFGVQGRYFIPIAPILFMLFYNNYLNPKFNLLFSPLRKEYRKAKPKNKPLILAGILDKEQLFDKYLYLTMACFCLFTLSYAMYLTMIRYYDII